MSVWQRVLGWGATKMHWLVLGLALGLSVAGMYVQLPGPIGPLSDAVDPIRVPVPKDTITEGMEIGAEKIDHINVPRVSLHGDEVLTDDELLRAVARETLPRERPIHKDQIDAAVKVPVLCRAVAQGQPILASNVTEVVYAATAVPSPTSVDLRVEHLTTNRLAAHPLLPNRPLFMADTAAPIEAFVPKLFIPKGAVLEPGDVHLMILAAPDGDATASTVLSRFEQLFPSTLAVVTVVSPLQPDTLIANNAVRIDLPTGTPTPMPTPPVTPPTTPDATPGAGCS